ncbi:MAG TPA: HPr family phosphocarrier protein [Caldilineae bacterium]|nr:HPr family phosphocarrier protein [Caldilineae bacterium]
MPAISLTVSHAAGLHARPAAEFVKKAASFPCQITVRNVTDDKPPVNAKSILSVLTLGVNQGYEIEVVAEGENAEQALTAIADLVNSNFGE